MLAALGLGESTVLVAPEQHDAVFWKSARNIAGVSVTPVADLNAWALLSPRAVGMTTAAIDAFRAAAKSQAAAGRQPARRAPSPRPRSARSSGAKKGKEG
jgi:large subunit ribosomal protein L4